MPSRRRSRDGLGPSEILIKLTLRVQSNIISWDTAVAALQQHIGKKHSCIQQKVLKRHQIIENAKFEPQPS